jgi:hypothetical protein
MGVDSVVVEVLSAFFTPTAVVMVAVGFVLFGPLPGRGPGYPRRRDPWRTFRFDARRAVMSRAEQRCEGALFFGWGRCRDLATEVDHIYPWSKGGATVVSNGQAMCHRHNRAKSNMTPAWWYVLSLERHRRTYFPEGTDVRVHAAMGRGDREARTRWAAKRQLR